MQDFDSLKQKYDELNTKYKRVQEEIREIADFSTNKISESKFEIDKLRAELEEVTKENY